MFSFCYEIQLDLIAERNRWVSKSVDLVDQFGLEI